MLGSKPLQVSVRAGRVVGSDALLVDLRVGWQFSKEWSQFLWVVLGNGFSRVDAWAPRENVELVSKLYNRVFCLPIIFDDLVSTRVQIKHLRKEVVVLDPDVPLLDLIYNINCLKLL